MFETRGRKSKEAYVDGGYYVVKRPNVIGGSTFVGIPKDWIDAVSLDRPLLYFLLDLKDTQIIIRPHFEGIPELEDE